MINKELLTKSIVSSFLGSFVSNINSINSIDVAKKRNIRVSSVTRDEPSEYNSLVRLIVTTEKRTRSVAGSIFGGEPRIVEIKGIKINAELGNFNIYLTKIILSLFPQPDLWIHLKNKPEIIWKRKKEIEYEDLLHQLKDYKNFFKNKKNLIIYTYKKDLKIIEINIIKLLNSLK